MNLRPFQRRFLRRALAPGVRTAVLSLPRGNGKSTLAARILADRLAAVDGTECVLLAGSLLQARVPFRMVRAALGEDGWRWADSATMTGGRHLATGTRLRVVSGNPKTALGWQGVPLVVADEPGAWEVAAGEGMIDAIQTAQGKPDSPLRAILIGTVAPAVRGWWPELVAAGSRGSVHVTALQGRVDRWDKASEIRRCNPLMWAFPASRAVLLDERDAARADSRLRARFLSYRLNTPAGDESTVLLSVPEYEAVCGRPVPDREGRPVVGVDLGGGRAWSAAVAVWANGRTEAIAVAPGVPSLGEQEKRDRVPRGTYQRLAESGALLLADGLRVPPVGQVVDAIREWRPAVIVCDRFRLAEALDHGPPCPVEPRVGRWSEQSEDIRALRKAALDGPLSVDPGSRALIGASLAVAAVKHDDGGNVRLVKRGTNNTARDDVAAALVLAAGEAARRMRRPPKPLRIYRAS